MRRNSMILALVTLALGAASALADGLTFSATLDCKSTNGTVIDMPLSSFNFATTQLIDPNTGLPTGKIVSSLKFGYNFSRFYKQLQSAAENNQTFSSCTLMQTIESVTGITSLRWGFSNATLTDLSLAGQEGSSGSLQSTGTLTFKSVEFN